MRAIVARLLDSRVQLMLSGCFIYFRFAISIKRLWDYFSLRHIKKQLTRNSFELPFNIATNIIDCFNMSLKLLRAPRLFNNINPEKAELYENAITYFLSILIAYLLLHLIAIWLLAFMRGELKQWIIEFKKHESRLDFLQICYKFEKSFAECV